MKTLRDVMAGHKAAKIVDPMHDAVVRILRVLPGETPAQDVLDIDAITETIMVPLDTALTYQPWCLDRGNLVFFPPNVDHTDPMLMPLKFCTELDIVVYDDGTSAEVVP